MGQFIVPKIGCRWSMIALSFPLVVGWVTILITKPLNVETPALFYVGRIILGNIRKSQATVVSS